MILSENSKLEYLWPYEEFFEDEYDYSVVEEWKEKCKPSGVDLKYFLVAKSNHLHDFLCWLNENNIKHYHAHHMLDTIVIGSDEDLFRIKLAWW